MNRHSQFKHDAGLQRILDRWMDLRGWSFRNNLLDWLAGMAMSNFICKILCTFAIGIFSCSPAYSQQVRPGKLVNGDLEEVDGDQPSGWRFHGSEGAKLVVERGDKVSGNQSVLIDASECDKNNPRNFSNLSQSIDPENFRGKRMRLRAAVKTAGLVPEATANLWFRVDRKLEPGESGSATIAFDNMQNRPILKTDWQHYDVVLDIGENAEHIIVGCFVIGIGKVWLDDVTFEEVSKDVKTTDMNLGSDSDPDNDQESFSSKQGKQSSAGGKGKKDSKKSTTVPSRFPPALQKAFAEADKAPRQPFFNHWLWLVVIALVLFAISGCPARETELTIGDSTATVKRLGHLPRIAVRFSVAYWLLYSFPFPISRLFPKFTAQPVAWYSSHKNDLVFWAAKNLFGIQNELVLPNGSGDTTFSYISIFVVFVLAIAVAILWTILSYLWIWIASKTFSNALWWRTDYRSIKDLLRSYLRYVLAVWMLTYGLGKVAWDFNQFPTVSEYQFGKEWGDSSPMNVVWAFMGSSRAYTIFAGLGEVIGGLLLIWRRTAVLGALVTLGVMINVMMLNYCYDIPVKIFSTHLVCMALYILLPDARRLTNVLFFNRSAEPANFQPPYTNKYTVWIQRVAKLTIIVLAVGIPCYKHFDAQRAYFNAVSEQPEFFGQYEVEKYELAGKEVPDTEHKWKSVRFATSGTFTMDGKRETQQQMIVGHETYRQLSNKMDVADDGKSFSMSGRVGLMPNGKVTIEKLDDERIRLTGDSPRGEMVLTLKRNEEIYLITGRGYRWINEVPFNR